MNKKNNLRFINKKLIIAVLTVLAIIPIIVFSLMNNNGEVRDITDFLILDNELKESDMVHKFVKENESKEGIYSITENGNTFILITSGIDKKNNSKIILNGLKENDKEILVDFNIEYYEENKEIISPQKMIIKINNTEKNVKNK